MPARNQPAPTRRFLWLGLAAIVLLLCIGGYYFTRRPAPAPSAPTASVPTPTSPIVKKHIYSETANPAQDITAALQKAKSEHKRVLLDFGGDWCGDCQVLDIYFHEQPNEDLLDKNFVLVHVWIGHIDTHLDVPEKYGVPIHKGVPALAVLDSSGKVVYTQNGEFEDMRHMEAASVTDFLEKWKA